jgi:hypothetical protein
MPANSPPEAANSRARPPVPEDWKNATPKPAASTASPAPSTQG